MTDLQLALALNYDADRDDDVMMMMMMSVSFCCSMLNAWVLHDAVERIRHLQELRSGVPDMLLAPRADHSLLEKCGNLCLHVHDQRTPRYDIRPTSRHWLSGHPRVHAESKLRIWQAVETSQPQHSGA